MDGSHVIMEGSLLSRYFLLQWMASLVIMEGECVVEIFVTQWMIALSLWKVVYCRDFVTPKDGILAIMECSPL